MRYRPGNETETLDRAARFSGQSNHESPVDDNRKIPRKNRVLRQLHRLVSHDFTETRKFAYGDLAQRLRCHVAQGYSRAAGGQNQYTTSDDLLTHSLLDE